MNAPHQIVICMGSSCFARGNRSHLALIETFLSDRGLHTSVAITGSHCEQQCAEGPNIRIDGRLYHHLDEGTLLDVLEAHFTRDTKE